MVMQPTHGNGVIESPTIEISHEGLRLILNQIEAELLNSEVYRRTMAGLQTMLGEASSTAQILVKAVGREAVRLTFQELKRQHKIIPVSSEKTDLARQEEQLVASHQLEGNPVHEELHVEATLEEIIQLSKLNGKVPGGETKLPKKLTKAELAAQKTLQEREEMIRQVGQELLRVRLARSLSIEQLHNQTLVPPRQIEALESGRIDQLPEDVYIRGFIRRLARVLGLNGEALVASIPEPDLSKSAVPSWYNSIAVPGFQINSLHLYLGYTALIAGAVGGLSLMSNKQASPGVSAAPDPAGSSRYSPSPKLEHKETTSKPGLQSSTAGIKVGGDMAHPETSLF